MKKRIIELVSLLFLLLVPLAVHADEKDQVGSFDQMVGFRVEPVTSVHQVDPKVEYFYLKEKPGVQDKVKLKLINTESQPKKIELHLNNASTNSNGLIVYEHAKAEKTIKIPMTQLAQLSEQEVDVPARSVKEVEVRVKTPTQSFSGISLGGIVIQEKPKSAHKSGISNLYSYTVGLVVTESEHPQLYGHTNLKLSSVKAGVKNGYKVIEARILNPYPEIFNQAEVEGEIRTSKGKVLYKQQLAHVGIAPQTIFPLSFDTGKLDLKAGNYLFKGKVKAAGKEWNFEQKFKITKSKAYTLNKMAVNKYYLPNYIYHAMFVLTLMTLGNMIYLMIRKGRRGGER